MGLRLLTGIYDGTQHDATVMVDSTSGEAFGPVFGSYDDAEDFIAWFASAKREDAARELGIAHVATTFADDPRAWAPHALTKFYAFWQTQRTPAV